MLIGGICLVSTGIKTGIELNNLVPADSYVANYIKLQSSYFPNGNLPFYIVFPELDYANHSIQDSLVAIKDSLEVPFPFLAFPFLSLSLYSTL